MAREVLVAVLTLGMAAARGADDGVTLKEEAGGPTRVLIEMQAEGQYRPEPPPGSPKATPAPTPRPLKIESRLDFFERVARRSDEGAALRSARRAVEAATAIGGVGGRLLKLRPEVALLVADRRDQVPVVSSVGGPLTRWELEMVQVPGDPMALAGLLPERPVKLGDRWPVSAAAVKNLTDYDALTSNGLEAKLDALAEDEARIKLGGVVRGSARGGDGEIRFTGRATFDRKAKRISRLDLERDEARKQGLVEWGLAVKSRITVERDACQAPQELSDDALAALARDDDPRREWLRLEPPDARYTLAHDRDWHLTLESPRLVVLKRLDKGELLAQCNLSVGPNAGKGRHQDLEEFRADIKKALGPRFLQVVGEGEVPGSPEGGFRHKVAVAGREGALDVLWFYYLIAGPEGDQLLATFTLDAASAQRFGAEDEALIGTLEWKPAGAVK